MEANTLRGNISNQIQNWIITLFIIFFIFCGVCLSLMCIYALPDRSVRPFQGSIYFASSSAIIIGLLTYLSKRENTNILKRISNIEFKPEQIVIQVGILDKILKWLVTILSVFFVILSFLLTLICIYALPNKTIQPITGTVYCLCGSIVLSVFIFVLWKNWTLKKP
jgi:hypothetical protein